MKKNNAVKKVLISALVVGAVLGTGKTSEASTWRANSIASIQQALGQDKAKYGENVYDIRWGDYLYGISQATGVNIDTLASINKIANKNLIYTGNKLYYGADTLVTKDNKGNVTAYRQGENGSVQAVNPNQLTNREQRDIAKNHPSLQGQSGIKNLADANKGLIAENNQKLKELEGKVAEYKKQKEATQKTGEGLKESLQKYRNDLDKIKDPVKRAEIENKIKELENLINSETQKGTDLDKKIEDQNKEIEKLRKENEQLRKEIKENKEKDKAKTDNNTTGSIFDTSHWFRPGGGSTTGKTSDSDKKIKDLENAAKEKQAEQDKLKKEIEDLEKKIKDNSDRIAELEKHKNGSGKESDKEIAENKNKLEGLKQEQEKNKASLDEINKNLENSKNQLKEIDEKIKALEENKADKAELDNLKAEKEQLTNKIAELEKSLAAADQSNKDETDKIKKELDEARNNLGKVDEKIKGLEDDSNRKAEIEALKAQKDELAKKIAELEESKSNLENKDKEIENKIKELENLINSETQKGTDLDKKVENQNKEIEKLTKENEELRKEIDKIKEELGNLKKQADEAKDEALKKAKEAAIKELAAAGITDEESKGKINAATTVEDVERIKNELLDAKKQADKDEALKKAKEAAIKELAAAGITDEESKGKINAATTVEDVERIKNELLDAKKQADKDEALKKAKEAAIKELAAAGITDEESKGKINAATTVEEVERIKNELLDGKKQADKDEALKKAKEAAIKELAAAGITDEESKGKINAATTVEEVERIKNELLDGKKQADKDEALKKAKEAAIKELAAAGITDEESKGKINAATTVEEVERIKNELLATKKQFTWKKYSIKKEEITEYIKVPYSEWGDSKSINDIYYTQADAEKKLEELKTEYGNAEYYKIETAEVEHRRDPWDEVADCYIVHFTYRKAYFLTREVPVTKTKTSKGDYIENVKNPERNAYPDNGEKGDFWYEFVDSTK